RRSLLRPRRSARGTAVGRDPPCPASTVRGPRIDRAEPHRGTADRGETTGGCEPRGRTGPNRDEHPLATGVCAGWRQPTPTERFRGLDLTDRRPRSAADLRRPRLRPGGGRPPETCALVGPVGDEGRDAVG